MVKKERSSVQITCITFSSYFAEAEKFIRQKYPGQEYQIWDIRRTLLNPVNLANYLSLKVETSFALIMYMESGESLDIMGALVFLTKSRRKFILDMKENVKVVSVPDGLRYIGGVLIDVLTFLFAVIWGYFRALTIGKRRKVRLDMQNRSVFYLRTDLLPELKSGGSVAHTTGVLKSLTKLGYRPVYYGALRMRGVEDLGIEVIYVEKGSWLRNWPELPAIGFSEILYQRLKNFSLTDMPSFIYQRYSLNNYAGALFAGSMRKPFILEYNGSEMWVARNWGSALLFRGLAERIEMVNLVAADLVVAVSRPLKDELLARGIDDGKILVNPNGVDPGIYSPAVNGSVVRNQYNLGDNVVIGFIGTFGRWHGAEVLAEALGMLIHRFPEYRGKVRLLMVGDGVTMPEVRKNMERYGIAEEVVLTGLVPQQEGPSYLAACDILVSPHVPNPDGTPFFGSPTKLFEYMAMGKGIVASNLEQIGEVLEHGRTAWMVKPGDVESLVAGLKTLIDDDALRNRLGAAAREEVIRKYTWEEHTRRIIEKLNELCGGSEWT